MPRWLRFALPLAASLALASPAAAYTYGDTLTLIWKPLPNLPALARPGDDVTSWANAPSSASDWSASLELASLSYPLAPASATYEAGYPRWLLKFTVPAGLPEELYDLSLTCATCAPDVAKHAVKVLPAFKSDFYFAQISDTHLPEHTFSSDQGFSTADTTGLADFDAVIDDLNLIHPEFIIHTGDFVNEGELEEYLAMYEMGRAQQMITRLRDPMFLSSGNHDQGGWKPTPPPDGTARKNWWRYFGWPYLLYPPQSDEHHSQDYSFDYGLLHCVGLEAYINNGNYDSYRTDIWGAQSFTAEQMDWLVADLAAVPAGHSKLVFYHYDFGGTLGNGSPGSSFSQINPSALGIDGAIWGHNHGVAEDYRTLRSAHPFDLGLQSVIDRRAFRIFRVHNGAITPGPRHHSGGTSFAPTDSLTAAWNGPNNGSRSSLSVTITNRFSETWNYARLVFYLLDSDSGFSITGGTLAQVIRPSVGVAAVYVDTSIPAFGTATVSAVSLKPAGVGAQPLSLELGPPSPNPFRPADGALGIHVAIARPGVVRLAIYDLGGRRVATLFDGPLPAGTYPWSWDGRSDRGKTVGPGIYVVRLSAPGGERQQKIAVMK